MPFCPSCGEASPEGAAFCAACGKPLDSAPPEPADTSTSGEPVAPSLEDAPTSADPVVAGSTGTGTDAAAAPESAADAPTSAEPVIGPAPEAPPPSISSPSGPQGGRFLPGTVISERYRVIGIVGRGGMGEVYRADDLKLGQTVALKFLSEKLAHDDDRRERLFDEVRTARKVSHPNVCRVWDIGEADGQQFISMEFVDGEDLASLLRRIGRAPKEKAAQIARQLCAGLAAAHEEGVLHRDLKPANVMIDGRGRVRLTDFGLASIAGEIRGDERAGTPIYMAPELLSGGTPSTSTDIYALGLVLYELFTGKRAYKADNLQELMDLQSATSLTSPGSLVDGMDPAVERIILACLNGDPRKRPQTALAVAGALPGGDPLAAALAAGETPAPELVAAADVEGALHPAVAALCLAGLGIGFALLIGIAPYWQLARMGPAPMSGDALQLRALDILATTGFEEPAVDALERFTVDDFAINFLATLDDGTNLQQRLQDRPGAIRYWYRHSPEPIVPVGGSRPNLLNPWMQSPGAARVGLDTQGNLLDLWIVGRPAWRDEPREDVDWEPFFAAADLDPGSFELVAAQWTRGVDTDVTLAWQGIYPDSGGLEVIVEAGSLAGRPVHFRIAFPWEAPTADGATGTGLEMQFLVVIAWFMATLIGAVVVARRNLRLGRGDRRGATRLAGVTAFLWFANWVFMAHHTASPGELLIFVQGLSDAVFWGGLVWVFYIAIEPYYRRTWPGQLVSWVRMLDGRFRDPLVGRDLLIGCLSGVLLLATGTLLFVVVAQNGLSEIPPQARFGASLGAAPAGGLGEFAGMFAILTGVGIFNSLLGLITLIVFRLTLRHTVAAVLGYLAIVAALVLVVALNPLLLVTWSLAAVAASLFVLFRFGVLPAVLGNVINLWLLRFTLTADLGSWYISNTIFIGLIIGGLAIYGFYTSLAGRSVFGDADEEPSAVA